MVPGGKVEVINMSQYDSDVILELELYASEGIFVVQSGTTATIRGTKPDGHGIDIDADIETTQGVTTVTVEVDPQMTAIAGRALYELRLLKDEAELNTANFVLDIEQAPLDVSVVSVVSVVSIVSVVSVISLVSVVSVSHTHFGHSSTIASSHSHPSNPHGQHFPL